MLNKASFEGIIAAIFLLSSNGGPHTSIYPQNLCIKGGLICGIMLSLQSLFDGGMIVAEVVWG